MANRTKQRRSGGLTLLLYQRALHPELFRILSAQRHTRRAYDADVWLVESGHVVSFQANGHTLVEVIAVRHEPLTDRGLVQTIPCRGRGVSKSRYRVRLRRYTTSKSRYRVRLPRYTTPKSPAEGRLPP